MSLLSVRYCDRMAYEFDSAVETVAAFGDAPVVRIPFEVSLELPSRGMCIASVTIQGKEFTVPLEPDGENSHWFRVPETLSKASSGESLQISMEVLTQWPEPRVPADIEAHLAKDEAATAVWKDITPAARWEWVRWAAAVKQEATRVKRVESINSRLLSGKRRPCCFDRSQCTLTDA